MRALQRCAPRVHTVLHLRVVGRSVPCVSDYEVDLPPDLSSESWFRVTGGHLAHALEVKVAIHGGRAVLVGMRLDTGAEIKARDLRSIRVPAVAQAVVDAVQRTSADLWPSSADLDFLHGYGGPSSSNWADLERAEAIAWDGAAAQRLQAWLDDVATASPDRLLERGRGSKPPTLEDYRAFAKAYLEEHQRAAHGARPRGAADGEPSGRVTYGAKANVARRLHMDRATVYRWAKAARELGLLPDEEDGDAS